MSSRNDFLSESLSIAAPPYLATTLAREALDVAQRLDDRLAVDDSCSAGARRAARPRLSALNNIQR